MGYFILVNLLFIPVSTYFMVQSETRWIIAINAIALAMNFMAVVNVLHKLGAF